MFLNFFMGFFEALQWLAEKWWLWVLFFSIWIIVTLIIKGHMSLFGAIGTALIVPVAAVFVAANLINTIAWASRWLPEQVEKNTIRSPEFNALVDDLKELFDAPPDWLLNDGETMAPPDGSDPNHGGYAPGYDQNQGEGSIPPDQSPYTPALEPEYSLVQVPNFEQCIWDAYKGANWVQKIQFSSNPPWGDELTDWSPVEILVIKEGTGKFFLFSSAWPGAVNIERVVYTRWKNMGMEIGVDSAKKAIEKALEREISQEYNKAFSVSGSGVYPPECYTKQLVEPTVPTTIPTPPAPAQQAPATIAPTPTPGIPVVEPVFN